MLSQLTYKEYLKVTIPFMLSTATQPLLGAVNTAVMGHMSEAFYIAAVSLGVILFKNDILNDQTNVFLFYHFQYHYH